MWTLIFLHFYGILPELIDSSFLTFVLNNLCAHSYVTSYRTHSCWVGNIQLQFRPSWSILHVAHVIGPLDWSQWQLCTPVKFSIHLLRAYLLSVLPTPCVLLPRSLHVLHFSFCHGGMSNLNWYKLVNMGYLWYAVIWLQSINMFSLDLQSGVIRYFHWILIYQGLYVCVYQGCPQTLAEICRNMGISDVFEVVREMHPDFTLRQVT